MYLLFEKQFVVKYKFVPSIYLFRKNDKDHPIHCKGENLMSSVADFIMENSIDNYVDKK